MTDATIETRSGRECRRRHAGHIRNTPVGDHDQTPGETEPVSGAGYRTVVGQVLGDLLEPTSDDPIEWLQEEEGLANAVEQLPGRITAGQVRQLVREEAFPTFEGEIADALGTADLGLSDARGKGHCNGWRSAQPDCPAQTHGSGQAVEEPSRGTKTARLQQSSEIEDRAAEDQQCQHRPEAPQRKQGHRPDPTRRTVGGGGG